MTPAPFTSALTGQLFGDPDGQAILSDDAFVGHLIAVEAAFARACGQVGLIPQDAADRISRKLAGLTLSPADLGPGMASAGVPVPALVAKLQSALGADGQYLHWGATSQDIVDCAHLLQWRKMLALLEKRLSALLDLLQAESQAHAGLLMAARTRSQVATPITLGLRLAFWAQPLIGLEQDLPALQARLLRVQFGGAAGSAGAVGPHAASLAMALAQELGLADGPCWHTDRGSILALGGWLSALTAALAKAARDLIVLGRSEIAELRAGSGGGSSTMPQKSNPVAAEAILTLADFTACLQPALSRAAMPLEERDGAAWALEWLALPQMGMSAAAALRHADGLMSSLRADADRMRATLQADHSAVLSEAASFALAAYLPRPEATRIVRSALEQARKAGLSLPEALGMHPETAGLPDLSDKLTPESQVAAARDMAARIFSLRRAL